MSKTDITTLINGVAADYLNVNDRAIHYGDGLFETILCNNNKLFYWQQHYQRLKTSANRLKMHCPDEPLLLADIKTLLNGVDDSSAKVFAIKIIVSRGSGERGYQFSKAITINRIVMLSVLNADYSSLITDELLSGDLYLCQQQVSINENLAGLKHLNRLENILARNEWKSAGENNNVVDGLMLNANKHVIEATMSNLFAVKNKKLFTPKLDMSGVNGIMREILINVASHIDIEVCVVDLSLKELYSMDEVFVSNSLIGLKSIDAIADKKFTSHHLTQQLFNELLKTKDQYAQVS